MEFETEFTGVTTGESPAPEATDNQTAPEESAVDNQSSELQDNEQADIQDSTTIQTVPYDRFSEVNNENKQLKEQIGKLLDLQLHNSRPQTQQQGQEEMDLVDQIVGDEEFITKDKLKEIVKYLNNTVNNTVQTVNQTVNRSSKEQILMQEEQSFRQSNADYDTVIKNIPQKVLTSLLQSYENPKELIAVAYQTGKAFTPQKATETKQQAKQPAQKPVTLNSVKGTSAGRTDEKPPSFEEEFRQSIGR